ncbi:MAG TPA: O-antigen ligase family protein [Stellaceae bacterium]|nr:O-antigen ligase family protein [Stellaceae bacterium]
MATMRQEAVYPPLAAGRDRLADAYLFWLFGVLAGYVLLGKGFAYLGMPPLYVGDLTLLVGMLLFLRLNCFAGILATLPMVLFAVLAIWVVARTVPYIGRDGTEALRDTVVVTYGGFAVIVIALLLEDASRINAILRNYRRLIAVIVPASTFLCLLQRFMGEHLPNLPGSDIPVLGLQPGDPAVNLAGAIVFMLAGLRQSRLLWNFAVFVSLAVVASLSRGPLLAAIVPIVFAALLLGKWRQLVRLAAIGLALFGIAYVIEPAFQQYHDPVSSQTRPISTRQVVENVEGILGRGDAQGQGTKRWRIDFWDSIVADTIHGPYFWTGRGFGVNLAEAYGFPGHNDPKLRDPHNVVMTMLARAGVPGAALWLLFVASWFAMMLRAMMLAQRRGQPEWAGLFVFAMSYVLSLIINACFDPSLEGPMQGVWFWCLIGFGTGSAMIYRQSSQPPALAMPAAPPARLRVEGPVR